MISKNAENHAIYIFVEKENLFNLVQSLQSNSMFQIQAFNDLCVIDYPEKLEDFELTYNLLSIKYNFRLIVKTILTTTLIPWLLCLKVLIE